MFSLDSQNFLHQTLVAKLPDALVICNEPPTKESLHEMDKLVCLMLGAAVQCNQRVAIVEAIKTLPVGVQEEIAMKIKEVKMTHIRGCEKNTELSLLIDMLSYYNYF